MNGDDRSGLGCNRCFDFAGIDGQRVFFDIDENGNRPESQGCGCRRDKRIRRHDHLVPRFDSDSLQGDGDRYGSVHYAHGMLRVLKLGEPLFQFKQLGLVVRMMRLARASPFAGFEYLP